MNEQPQADVQVNNVTANFEVWDAGALLSPQLLERVVQAVMSRMSQEMAWQRERIDETTIRRAARSELN
jgi:hypothetical protein